MKIDFMGNVCVDGKNQRRCLIMFRSNNAGFFLESLIKITRDFYSNIGKIQFPRRNRGNVEIASQREKPSIVRGLSLHDLFYGVFHFELLKNCPSRSNNSAENIFFEKN